MTRTAAILDLTITEPRPMDATLDGYAWLPRMFDKARATLAHTNGDYLFGCPIDHTCMARLNITPQLILELVSRHPDDADVLAALKTRGIPSTRDAWFDAPAVEHELQHGAYLRVRRQDQLQQVSEGRVFEAADQHASLTITLIDSKPGEGQALHSHPEQEIVIIQRGQATFSLGTRQARIITAGQIVQIPAEITHSYQNTSDRSVIGIAIHTAPAPATPALTGMHCGGG
jgi:quercetin dioxygenase-like cupin family protein